jgi:hypothetical protein
MRYALPSQKIVIQQNSCKRLKHKKQLSPTCRPLQTAKYGNTVNDSRLLQHQFKPQYLCGLQLRKVSYSKTPLRYAQLTWALPAVPRRRRR